MDKRPAPTDSGLLAAWLPLLKAKVRPPVCVVLGSPRQAVELVESIPLDQAVLYQMDLHQADRISELLDEKKLTATVSPRADLWDLPGDFQTVIFPVEPTGERMLKLDMIEQAFHILKPQGILIVLSRQDNDQFFPAALKKIYGRVHIPELVRSDPVRSDPVHRVRGNKGPMNRVTTNADATLLWCQRTGERPRRRHEITFQVSNAEGDRPSFRFLSRPGTFSYGRFDHGARALVDTAVINPGDAILDLGCGCGTNGIICGLRGGPDCKVTFVDSNCRATALADLNAKANGLSNFEVLTRWNLDGMAPRSFDVVLANPPYFANLTIAQRFIEQSRPLLKPGGRFYLVTKRPEQVGPAVADHFGTTEVVERRGYVILCATAK